MYKETLLYGLSKNRKPVSDLSVHVHTFTHMSLGKGRQGVRGNVSSGFPDTQCVTFIIGKEGRCTEDMGFSSFPSILFPLCT